MATATTMATVDRAVNSNANRTAEGSSNSDKCHYRHIYRNSQNPARAPNGSSKAQVSTEQQTRPHGRKQAAPLVRIQALPSAAARFHKPGVGRNAVPVAKRLQFYFSAMLTVGCIRFRNTLEPLPVSGNNRLRVCFHLKSPPKATLKAKVIWREGRRHLYTR